MIISRRTIGYLALAAVILMLPAFVLGAAGGDLHCQSLWTLHFSRELWSGVLYPRWLPDLNAGNGSPAFFYYPPFAYYVSALFYPLASLDPFGYMPMAASGLLAVFCSGLTFFLWIRENTSEESAIAASILYMVLPFHMGQPFYYTLLYSTAWAYAWLPLLFIATRRIVNQLPFGISLGAISTALMLCTNLPSALITLPLTCAYGLCIPRKLSLLAMCKYALLTGVLALGLAAFFLLPSLSYTSYGVMDLHWRDPRHEVQHFFTTLGVHNYIQAFNSCVWLIHAVLIILLYRFSALNPSHSLRRFGLIASLIALLMMLSFGYILWQWIPLLSTLQHPWRLFIIPTFCISMFTAFSLPQHKRLVVILIVASVAIDWMLAYNAHVTPATLEAKDPVAYERFEMQVEQYPEYLSFLSLIKRYYTAEGMQDVKKHLAELELVSGAAQMQVTEWKARHVTFNYAAPAETRIAVRQMYYPGWQASLGDTPLPTAWDDVTGKIVITVPAGSGAVSLDLYPLWPETLGKLISLLSFAALALSLLVTYRRTKQLI